MNMLSYTSDPRDIARLLEDRETARTGSLPAARASLARRIGCAPGTLETLRKGRLKRIEGWLHQKLEALLIREIDGEIRRLTRELETYRLAHGDMAGAPEMARLVEAIATAQRLIETTQIPTIGERDNGETEESKRAEDHQDDGRGLSASCPGSQRRFPARAQCVEQQVRRSDGFLHP